MTYQIIRNYFNDGIQRDGRFTRILKQGLTLEEAQAHCNDPETSSKTATSKAAQARTKKFGQWFDSYEEQPPLVMAPLTEEVFLDWRGSIEQRISENRKMTKRQFEVLKDAGVRIDACEVVSDIVNRLLDSLFIFNVYGGIFQRDPLRCKQYNIEEEPINWGDLKCCEVIHPSGNDPFIVLIEECAPNECPTLCAFIQEGLRSMGWDATIKTEW